jgi:hypothetical protein
MKERNLLHVNEIHIMRFFKIIGLFLIIGIIPAIVSCNSEKAREANNRNNY